MRLLNTETFEVEEFIDNSGLKYAILSHTWGKDEISFQNIQALKAAEKRTTGFSKIVNASNVAKSHGYSYIWIDTCCIDKHSSAELSEAINSMYRYYKESCVCYVYFADFFGDKLGVTKAEKQALRSTRWFSRGWTLQELIAPSKVEFYSADWKFLGTKKDIQYLLSDITGIDLLVLNGGDPMKVSVARKMSWAAKRETTRIEDTAYCLMGLFNVHMPLLYGEGTKSFFRLQNEILKDTNDQSIFVWQPPLGPIANGEYEPGEFEPLASSPKLFETSGRLISSVSPRRHQTTPIMLTSEGARTSLLVLHDRDKHQGAAEAFGILDCQYGPIPGTCPLVSLSCIPWGDSVAYIRSPGSSIKMLNIDLGTIKGIRRLGFDPDEYVFERSSYKDALDNFLRTRLNTSGTCSFMEITLSWATAKAQSANQPLATHVRASDNYEVVDVYPKEGWDPATSVVHRLDSAQNVPIHAALLIRCRSDLEDHDPRDLFIILLGVYSIVHVISASLPIHLQRVVEEYNSKPTKASSNRSQNKIKVRAGSLDIPAIVETEVVLISGSLSLLLTIDDAT
ncbi:heterokaryon incompatibility protein-domain-containing protein [Bisporella sp. PMI_857]|nr:heterokaryon incompatibility protein-domain-containing protein [Bisporella sp. PMI_857]